MRSTLFQHRNAYAGPMLGLAEIEDDRLRLRFRMPRPFDRLFGLRAQEIMFESIETIAVVRNPLSMRQRTHLVADGELFQLSSWVGEEMMRRFPELRAKQGESRPRRRAR